MTQIIPADLPGATSDRAGNVTRSLLGYGVLAGPLYVGVSLVEAATREGFDLTRHSWSLLANGPFGWVHVANFAVTGLMTLAFATGLHRVLRAEGGIGARWAPRLLGVYGASLIAAGIFRADPALGFPPGTPEGPGPVSWHGAVHLAVAGIGFGCLVAACFVLARRFAREGRRDWAVASAVTGAVFLLGFGAIASGQGGAAAVLSFVTAILLAWAWIAAVAVHMYRRTR